MKTSTTIRITRIALAAVVMSLCAVTARGSASSTNYGVIEESFGAGGGDAFSSNYKLVGMFPEGAIGPASSSTNYRVEFDLVPVDFLPDDTTPPVITIAPTVIYLSNNRALIEWTTDELANGSVDSGTTMAYGTNTVQSGGYSTLHQVLVTGLAASTLYNYRVSSTDPYLNGPTQSANATFTTMASADNAGPVVTPTVTVLGVTAAQIDFTTDEAATTILRHGPTAALGTNVADPVFSTSHTATLTALPPGTTYNYSIDATDPSGNPTSGALQTFNLPAAVAITTTSAPSGMVGEDYGATISATGGLGTLSFSIASGALPPGLSITSTGIITGTPTNAGTFGFTVSAADTGTPVSQATRTYSVTVAGKSGGGGGGGGGGCAAGQGTTIGWILILLGGLATLALRRRRQHA